jgi:GNAT superfamily N-acetyltransferase
MPALRPMRDDDVAVAHDVMLAAFGELEPPSGEEPPPPPGDLSGPHERFRHLLRTDPEGAWVAVDEDDRPIGAALALVRDGVWGLSLLVVRPDAQSAGAGGALLRASLAHGDGARGGIVLASSDSRALRAYHRAGFTMHPAARATGVPRGVEPDPAVVAFDPERDGAMAGAIGRTVRGAAHGDDLAALARGGAELLALPGRGFAAIREGDVKLVAAADDAAAATLLRSALARCKGHAEVSWLTGAQRWAVDVVLTARMELAVWGAVFLRGDTGTFTPYLPSGAYL